MQFYYVKKNVELSLPGKNLSLAAPAADALLSQQIPLQHIHCGNTGWEVIHAQKIGGEDAAVVLSPSPEIQALLPPLLQPASSGISLINQLRHLAQGRPADRQAQPLRLALINGVGTMLGDTLVGSTALEIAGRVLAEAAVDKPEVHAVQAWNTRPGTGDILARCPAVAHVQGHSITLDKLRAFDAYWDFSLLLKMEGYNTRPLLDFYLNQFGIDPSGINPAVKRPVLRLPTVVIAEAKALLDQRRAGRKLLLIQGLASTPLRSMPDFFLVGLIEKVLAETDACILLTQPLPAGLSNRSAERIIHLEDWCRDSTDCYLALVISADQIVSIDSVAIHAAMAASLPGVVIFTTLPPALRLAYAPQLAGMLIPDAENLKTWGQHKTDDQWPDQQVQYNQAWAKLDVDLIIGKLI